MLIYVKTTNNHFNNAFSIPHLTSLRTISDLIATSSLLITSVYLKLKEMTKASGLT